MATVKTLDRVDINIRQDDVVHPIPLSIYDNGITVVIVLLHIDMCVSINHFVAFKKSAALARESGLPTSTILKSGWTRP